MLYTSAIGTLEGMDGSLDTTPTHPAFMPRVEKESGLK
jgi:hypothetical protein